MSFGYGVSDFILCLRLAHRVCQQTQDAPGDIRAVSTEVASLELLLEEVRDSIKGKDLSQAKNEDLRQLLRGSERVLVDLDILLKKYHSLGTEKKRAWNRLHWREPVEDIRLRLVSHVGLLTSFRASVFGYDPGSSTRLVSKTKNI